MTANRHVQSGLTWEGVRWAFSAFHSGHWHPLTWLSLMVDYELFGVRPGPMHAVNVVLHALNTILLFQVLCSATGAVGRSGWVAALFGLHPLRVESVAWVTERKDVLSVLLWLLTLAAYLRYVRRPAISRFAVVLAVFLLGLLAKPMLVTLPLVLLLLDYWPLERLRGARQPTPGAAAEGEALLESSTGLDELTPVDRTAIGADAGRASMRWLLAEKLPLLLLAGFASAVVSLSQRAAGAPVSLETLGLGQRLGNAAWGYVAYLGATVWPVELAVFYPLRAVPLVSTVPAMAALLAISTVAFGLRSRAPYLIAGWLWYLITLVPVIGLVQIGGQAMADRFTYIPHIGLFLAVVWGVADLAAWVPRGRGVAISAGSGALAALAALTWWQLGHWRDSVTVFSRALAVTTDNYMAHKNLGVALGDRGLADEAAMHYAEAVRINPTWPEAQNNLGLAHALRGDYAQASTHFREALRLRPDFGIAENNLATAYAHQGAWEDVLEHFSRAVGLQPEYLEARIALGEVLERLGRQEEAIVQYQVVLRQAPDDPRPRAALARLGAR